MVAVIVYASLYPFAGWRWPPGHELLPLMKLPWPKYYPRFDIWSNLLGYLPLGLMLYIAGRRAGWRPGLAFGAALAGGALLSFTMEVTQNFVPERVPSLLDLSLNSAGAGLGAALAALLDARGQLDRLQALRDRWFTGGSAGARVLLLLWPLALLFPAPVPLGVGQVLPALQELAARAVDGTALEEVLEPWLSAPPDSTPLSLLAEWATITLGLLAPCLLAHAALRPGWRRLVVVAVLGAVGFAATTLSTALNFGPQHATAWLTPATLPALAAGLVLAAATAWMGRRLSAALALVAFTALVALVSRAPADAYFAESLQGWQQGRFIRFHGLAQWVGWLWPYAAMGWLLARFAAHERHAG
jgi:VanZ family protein